MQGTVEWPQLMTIVGMIVSSGIGVAGVVVWLWSKLTSADREHRRSIEDLRQAQSDLRVEMAQKYVPVTELGKVEARIESALVALTAQFERGFDRLTDLISNKRRHEE